jgi:3-oxoadipate enol-lactonase
MKMILFAFFFFATTAVRAQLQGHIEAGGIKLHYQIDGSGKPLVLVHAGYLDMHMWDQQVSVFKKDHRVIRLDLPGHGGTTGTDTAMTVQDVIRIMLDSLHIPKASFAGVSLGGASVIDFALANPERVDKIVLVSSGLSGWMDVLQLDTLSKRIFQTIDSVNETNDHNDITETFTHYWFDGPYRRPAEMNTMERNYVYRTAFINDVYTTRQWPRFNKNPAGKRVSDLHVPVLILAGSLDVPFILNVAHYLHRTIKGSRLSILPDAAHMLNLEKPTVFYNLVSTFLSNSLQVTK